jgi:hypothetical protein
MRYKWNKIIAVMVYAGVLFLCAGCGKKEAPEVPSTRSSTLFEIFRLMDARQYRAALPLVEKYQSLEPANEFLSELRTLVCTNIAIQEAEALAQKGKLKEACAVLDKSIRDYGELPGILEAKQIYQNLLELGTRIQILREPSNSGEMLKHARWLAGYAARFRNVPLQNYARQKIRESGEVRKLEVDRAGFLIYADAMEQLQQNDFSGALALTALLAAERRYPVPVARIQNGGLYDSPAGKKLEKK